MRKIKKEQIDNLVISTIFLGNEYETMVFNCNDDGKITNFGEVWGERANTEEEILKTHEKAKQWVMEQDNETNSATKTK